MKKLITAILLTIMFGSMLSVFAEPLILVDERESTTISEGGFLPDVPEAKKYGLIDSLTDRLALIFTFKEEKKLEIMQKIQAKREAHYNFLMETGRTIQAEKTQEQIQEMQYRVQTQIQKTQERADILTNKLREMNRTR